MPVRPLLATTLLAALSLSGLPAVAKPCLSAKDLVLVKTPSDPRPSPDGRHVVFTLKTSDLEANRNRTALYIVSWSGGRPRRLTASNGSDFQGRWRPDGRALAFVSTRDGKAPGLWLLPMDGGDPRPVTNLPVAVTGPVWTPDGRRLLVAADLYRGCRTLKCSLERARRQTAGSPLLLDHLLYRHWNEWRGNKVSHVLEIDASTGRARDLTPGDVDVPPLALGSSHDYVYSPDGRFVAYTANTDRLPAASTNNDIFLLDLRSSRRTRLTRSRANQNGPAFSPDGRFLAYLSMRRPGYESDKQVLVVRELRSGQTKPLTAHVDLTVREFVWGPKGRTIYFTAPKEGHMPLFAVDVATGRVTELLPRAFVRGLAADPRGRFLAFVSQSASRPPELYRFDLSSRRMDALTHFNEWIVRDRALGKLSSFWFRGAEGDRVQAFLLEPHPSCVRTRRIPVINMIHGGPQGMVGDDFHPRWNSQLFAAPGYAVLMINFHGSVGYGQAFTDSIRGDWGGKPYQDIMLGLQAALKRHRRLDARRVCAAGASYGGYMVNWIGGHTDRYSCLVTHSGVFNLEAMYGATEELWFPEWEYHGPPWGPSKESQYRRWSPHNFVQNWKTPTLIIHGQRDYRVPVTQSMQLFTALQRRGIPSRFLYFFDEDHFVQKPRNRLLWWRTVHDWLARHLKKR